MSVGVKVDLKWVVEAAKVRPENFRDYVKDLTIKEIRSWLKFCQENAGKGIKRHYGLIYQDLINVLGEKLGFQVEFGDYKAGPDGIWNYEKVKLCVESETLPTWLNLKQVNDYIKSCKATCGIAVAPDFEEDQIRAASRYRSIRLLKTKRLLKLVKLREKELLLPENAVNFLVPREWLLALL